MVSPTLQQNQETLPELAISHQTLTKPPHSPSPAAGSYAGRTVRTGTLITTQAPTHSTDVWA